MEVNSGFIACEPSQLHGIVMVQRIGEKGELCHAKVAIDIHIHLIDRKPFVQLVPVSAVVEGENIIGFKSAFIVGGERAAEIATVACEVKQIKGIASQRFEIDPPVVVRIAVSHVAESNAGDLIPVEVRDGPSIVARHVVGGDLNAHQRSRGFLAEVHGGRDTVVAVVAVFGSDFNAEHGSCGEDGLADA